MISGKKISWHYKKERPVLNNVSFELRVGRITVFMGQSGAGKTTLLKCIANLNPHYTGIISCGAKDIKNFSARERASHIGYVHQQFNLFPHLTALENCSYALNKTMGITKEDSRTRSCEVLQMLGMSSFIHTLPPRLSGGQQQRVAIARALLLNPKILLLDEPTSALDPESKKSLESLLLDLMHKGMTLALSSHDMPFIRKIMDYIYFMEEGSIIEEWDSKKDDLSSKEKINQFLSNI